MSGATPQVTEFRSRTDTLAGWAVRIESYRVDHRWHASVDNVDPGARVARGEGATREEAEAAAIVDATRRLARTRRVGGDPTPDTPP